MKNLRSQSFIVSLASILSLINCCLLVVGVNAPVVPGEEGLLENDE